jgi:hypothetical protein
MEVGFPTFAALHLKNYVLAGASGTQYVHMYNTSK